MKLNHLEFNPEDLQKHEAKYCILSGDPRRSQLIAEQYLLNSVLVSETRGLLCYLGYTHQQIPIIAATSGMGAPSTSIVVNELIQSGITHFIRVGTTGALQKQIKAGDIIVNNASLCLQGAANDIAPVEYPAVSSPILSTELFYSAKNIHKNVFFGINASVDSFYEGQERYNSANPNLIRKQVGLIDEFRKLNILNIEMESGTLFKMSQVYGFYAASICSVVATRYEKNKTGEKINHSIIESTTEKCINAALNTFIKIHSNYPAFF